MDPQNTTEKLEKVAKTIVFDGEMNETIEELATLNHRSYTAQVTFMLEDYLEKRFGEKVK